MLSHALLNEPYSSQLIGGTSELDQQAMLLCLIPSLSPYWVFNLAMWMRQASRFQLYCQEGHAEIRARWLVCVPFIRAHIKRKGRVCGFHPSGPGVFCFHAEVRWGSEGLKLVYCQGGEVWTWCTVKKRKIFLQSVFTKSSLRHTQTHITGFPPPSFWVSFSFLYAF